MSQQLPDKKLDARKLAAIELLVIHRFDGRSFASIARELHISSKTLERWRRENPDFIAAYDARVEEWRRDFSAIRLSERKERVRELERMYLETPDCDSLRVVQASEPLRAPDGEELRDSQGRPVYSFVVYRSNIGLKRGLLAEIAEQLGDTQNLRDEVDKEPSPVAWARAAWAALDEMEAMDGAT